jgi:ribulose-phosphate 3-epimerase
MQVLPGINCVDRECVEGALGQIGRFLPAGEWIHLDIADGQFTFHKTWNEVALWPHFASPYKLEVHLMVERPEKLLEPWFYAGAKRAIVHWETLVDQQYRHNPSDPDTLLGQILRTRERYGAEVFLSTNPETAVEPLKVYFDQCDGAQVLAVHPGVSGQKFLPAILEKIRFLRRSILDGKIEVDGGITPETARLVKDAGASMVVSSNYVLFGGTDSKAAYEELKKI